MKKEIVKAAKGRRQEMQVALGAATIQRWQALQAEGDYAEIARRAKPESTRANIGKTIKNAADNKDWKMPLSIAQAIQAFYLEKEEAQEALSK
jgi:hypothetical protein